MIKQAHERYCTYYRQALRQGALLRQTMQERDDAYTRIAALEDDCHRLRRELGHHRPMLAVVRADGMEVG